MNLLIKSPSRSRAAWLNVTIGSALAKRSGKHHLHFVWSVDRDDPTIHEYNSLREAMPQAVDISVDLVVGDSKTKIEACNRDIPPDGWDVVLLSDDMECVEPGWDDRIAADMLERWPNLDGALHYPDGYREDLATISIMGRKLYQAFGYIYHPDYESVWCDNEFNDVCRSLNRIAYIPKVLIQHMHFVTGNRPRDALYDRNEAFMVSDQVTYERRSQAGFNTEKVRKALESQCTTNAICRS